jgi:outer membrane cobalamin receptor
MRLVLSFLFIFSLSLSYGQDKTPPLDFTKYRDWSLVKSLKSIDSRYSIPFSYNPKALNSITVSNEAASSTSIEGFLENALKESGFTFSKIGRTYVIYPHSEEPDEIAVTHRTNFTIAGIVQDLKTREALPFALISIPGTGLYTYSNSDGKFSIVDIPSDSLQLKISYLGYEGRLVALDSINPAELLFIQMKSKERILPSIQVTAETSELLGVDEIPGHLTLNTSKISSLPNLGEPDLFAALRNFPGIQGGADASSGLKIRGGASDQNLVLFDGITVYHVDHLFGFLTAFNSSVVKNVQVLKGGYRAGYGGRSSGLVEVTGINGNKTKPSLQAELGLLSASILAELPVVENKASIVFAYRRAYTDLIQTPTFQNIFNNLFNSSVPGTSNNNADVFDATQIPDFQYSDMNLKFNFQPSNKDDISLSYYEGRDNLVYTFTGRFENLKRESDDDTNWGNRGGSVKWSRKWNKRFYTYANYGVSNYTSDLEAEERFFAGDNDSLVSRLFYEQQSVVRDQTFRLDNTWEIAPNTKLLFGLWNTGNKITLQAQNQDRVLQDSLQEGRLTAAYTEVEYKMGKFSSQVGVRASSFTETSKTYVEPRLNLSYSLTPQITLKGAYGIYHQMIRRINERSLYLSVPETWALAGENIPVLRSDHYIAGVNYSKNDWTIDVEGYHKYEKGAIEFLFPEFGNPTANLNQFGVGGDRRIFGVDVLLKYAFANQNFMLSYSYLNAQSRYDELNDGQFFRSSGFAENEFNLIYTKRVKRWEFSATLVAASGLPYTPILGTFIVTLPNGDQQQFESLGATNSANLEWYHRMDLGTNYTFPLKNGVFQVGLAIYNVYNHLAVKYVDYFRIPQENTEFYDLGQRDVLALGFTPSIFLKLKL